MKPIHVKVKKLGNLLLPRAKDILPTITGLKITGQQLKDLARKELW